MLNRHCFVLPVVAALAGGVGADVRTDVVFVDVGNCPGPGDGSELDPYCSIQTAIDAAVHTDEIVVAPGTYFETINFLGKAITLRSSDGAETTSIDAGFSGTVVTCTSGEGPDTLLDGFTITGGSGVVGGGMFNAGASPTVRECVFTGNHAQFLGGAMFNDLGSTTVTDCLFESNSSDFDAGGIFNGRGSPLFLRCRFLGNAAGCFGGAILNANSDATLINCLLADNTAECLGGAITHAANNGILTAINCTITGNTAGDAGGGIHNFEDSLLLVHNCILWANADAGGMDSSAQIDGAAGITVSFSDVQGGFPGEANIDADPMFVDPDNGNHRLQSGSPCIDAADNTAVPEDITTDLDGNPRFVDEPDTEDTGNGEPPIVDMGAYEFQGLPDDCGGFPCGHNDNKVLLCHVPPGNPGNEHTLCISPKAVAAHLENHKGDHCGPCGDDDNDDAIQGDLDGDGSVGVSDLLALLAAWGADPGGAPDFDDDGNVGVSDLLFLLANWTA